MDRLQTISAADQQPSSPSGPPTLVIMVGPPGTGKSFLARQLVRHVPLEIVETDEIRRQLTPNRTYSREENRRVFQRAHREIDRLLRKGHSVLFDATNIRRRGRRALYRIAESVGARLLIVRTMAPDQVVAERLRERSAGRVAEDRSEAGWEVYVRMKAEYQEIERPHLVVDTSRDLEPAIQEIVRSIRSRG